MSQMFSDEDRVKPVTIVEAGPCVIIEKKDQVKHGYSAVQLGFGFRKKISKPVRGHLKQFGSFKHLKEVRFASDGETSTIGELGATITVSQFEPGDKIRVRGVSKGHGFQGVVKRHGFHGSPASHGHKDQLRHSGSIGAGGNQHVLRGTRMSGRMGGGAITVQGLKILKVDKEKNQLWVSGAIPGARNSVVVIESEQ